MPAGATRREGFHGAYEDVGVLADVAAWGGVHVVDSHHEEAGVVGCFRAVGAVLHNDAFLRGGAQPRRRLEVDIRLVLVRAGGGAVQVEPEAAVDVVFLGERLG